MSTESSGDEWGLEGLTRTETDGSPEEPAIELLPEDEAEPIADEGNDVREQLVELREANLRVRADFDNFRKRVARERLELTERARGDLVERLLPVVDNLERAVRSAEDAGEAGAWVEGIRMVQGQFLGILEDEGVRPIEAVGQEFDPMVHEAVATAASADLPSGSVLGEVRRGYRIGDRVLRPAQVVTSSGSP